MHFTRLRFRRLAALPLLTLAAALVAGCPDGQLAYELGYSDGFLEDDWYFEGFDDSYFTVDGGEIFYYGGQIPFIDNLSYDAGYWDGVWVAYNDGYFVAYDYAFTIGFSEGYDLFFAPDWQFLLDNDQHVEWLDGGFTDGYNDGFSEGRIFGAYDWKTGLPFDWLDAMFDYRAGIDLVVGDPAIGTGAFGPVELYEYGFDPTTLLKGVAPAPDPRRVQARSAVRNLAGTKQDGGIVDRGLTSEQRGRFAVRPDRAPRVEDRDLRLDSTWLDRINQYRDSFKAGPRESRRKGAEASE